MRSRPSPTRPAFWRLETARLDLRPPVASDLPGLVAAIDDRRISETTTIPHPYRRAEGLRFVRTTRAKIARGAGADLLAFAKDDGRLVGGVGLNVRELDRGGLYAEVGYWVVPSEWGQGYAGEMLEAMLGVGYRDLRLHRIEAWVLSFNPASVRVLTRAGFREEGRGREAGRHRGRYYDRILLGMLAAEYDSRPARGPPATSFRRSRRRSPGTGRRRSTAGRSARRR